MLFYSSSIGRTSPSIAGKFSDLAIRSSLFSAYSSTPADIFITHLLQHPNNLEKSLNSVKAKLDVRCITQVLETCALDKPQLGVRFFLWAGLHPTHRHTSFMYDKASKLLDIEKNPQVIINVIDGYLSEGFHISIKMFKLILNLCRAAKDADLSLWVLRKMKEFNCRPDTVCYNIVIRLLVEKGNLDEAMGLMKEMGLIDLYPDNITYVSILKGLVDCRRLVDAFSLLNVMKAHGCFPNLAIYSTLLDGICSCDEDPELVFDFLKQIAKHNGDEYEYKPNVVTYTTIVKSLSDKGKAIEAINVIDQMIEHNIKPNKVTFATVLGGLCKEGHVEEAFEVVNKFKGENGLDSDELHNLLVMALFNRGKYHDSEKLLLMMISQGLRPNGLASGLIIRRMVSEGRTMDGYVLFDTLEKSGNCLGTDSETCSTLLAALCLENRFAEATNVVDVMKDRLIMLNSSRVEAMVENLHACGQYHLVSSISSVIRRKSELASSHPEYNYTASGVC